MSGEQSRPAEAAMADQVLLGQLGVDPGFAEHITGMSDADLAVEITSALPGQDATEVLTGLMESGPELSQAETSAGANGYAEHIVFLSRAAAHLGLELVRRDA